jgi:sugar phosphate isomerase/epimerase
VRDYRALRQGGAADEDLCAILRHHGLRHIEVEFLLNWFADGEAAEQARRDEDLLYHMVETFEARVMYLGGDMTPGNPMPFDQLVERFAKVCGRAAEHGVTLGVEPCAWSNVGTLDEGLALVEGVGASNVGVVLDVWHLYRRGLDFTRLRGLDPAKIAAVQLGDAAEAVQGSLAEDSLDHRLLPGEGAACAAEFVAAVNASGYTGPMSVEVLSQRQRARPADDAARASVEAARSVIDRAGSA